MITYLRSGQSQRRLVRIGLVLIFFAACLTAIELRYGSRDSPDTTSSSKGDLRNQPQQDDHQTTGKYVAEAIRDLAKAGPMAIIVYELRDPPNSTGFGVLHANRTKKEGFEQIMTTMTDQQ